MKRNVLIIDGSSEDVHTLIKLLELYNVNILFVPDLKLATEIIDKTEITLVFVDSKTKDLNDMNVFNFIIKSPINKKAKVIAFSDNEISDFETKGYSAVVTRPFQANDFHYVVGDFLNVKRKKRPKSKKASTRRR